jgi:hypothetical protein
LAAFISQLENGLAEASFRMVGAKVRQNLAAWLLKAFEAVVLLMVGISP